MILVLAAICFGGIFGLLFAIWFLFDLRLRESGSDAAVAAAAAARRESIQLLGRFVPYTGIAVLIALPLTMGLGGWGRDSIEDSAYIAASAGLGVLLGLVVLMATPGIAVLASSRTAGAFESESGVSPGFTALWGGIAPALLAAVIGLAGPAALFGAYTAGLDAAVPATPQLIAGFAAGIGAVAGGSGLAIFSFHAGDEDAAGARGRTGAYRAFSTSALGLATLISLATAATTSIGAVTWMTTGEVAWMLLPAAILGFGIISSGLGGMSLAFWTRFSSQGTATWTGLAVVLTLTGIGALTAPLLMPESSLLLGLAGLAGVVGAVAVLLLPGSGDSSDGGSVAVAAVVVVAGALLGRETDIDGIASTWAALLGVSVAVAGLLAPSAYVCGARGAAAVARDGRAFAEQDGGRSLESWAEGIGARSRRYGIATMLLTGLLAVAAVLSVARWQTGTSTFEDASGYMDVAVDLHLVGDAPDLRAAASVEMTRFADSFEDLNGLLSEEEAAFLAVGHDPDIRAMGRRIVENEELSADETAGFAGGPLPLPRILPLDLASIPVLAGGTIAAALTLLATAFSSPKAEADGASNFRALGVLGAVLLLFLVAAVPIAFRLVDGGAAGWQAGAGALAGLIVAGLFAGRRSEGWAPACLMIVSVLVAASPSFVV